MSRTIRSIAVLGQGSIGRRHATILSQLGHTVFAYDPQTDFRVPDGVSAVGSEEEAIRLGDAVVVASPPAEHAAQTLRALSHGRAVLVEKPIAMGRQEAEEMVAAADVEGLVLAVGLNLRFHPGPSCVREVVKSGAIGQPLIGHFTFGSHLPGWRPGVDYRDTYSARRDQGGGVLLDVVHELDYAAWILGPLSDVSAQIDRVSTLEVDVEDVVLIQGRFDCGAVASFTLDYLDRSYRRGCRIIGSDGTVAWDWRTEQVAIERTESADREILRAGSDVGPTYRRELEEFIAAAQSGQIPADSPLASGREAATTMAIVEAARESSRTGCRVPVLQRNVF